MILCSPPFDICEKHVLLLAMSFTKVCKNFFSEYSLILILCTPSSVPYLNYHFISLVSQLIEVVKRLLIKLCSDYFFSIFSGTFLLNSVITNFSLFVMEWRTNISALPKEATVLGGVC